MPESEWLAHTSPDAMLLHVRGKVSNRKLRLFALACCRRIWHLLRDERTQQLLEIGERHAECYPEQSSDHLQTEPEIRAALEANRQVMRVAGASSFPGIAASAVAGAVHGAAWAAAWNATTITRRTVVMNNPIDAYPEAAAQAELLRHIVGNPFRPVILKPSWLAWNYGAVRKMSQVLLGEGRCEGLPLIADALEDAGCESREILAHCRSNGEHVRGCWVVDLLLGKS